MWSKNFKSLRVKPGIGPTLTHDRPARNQPDPYSIRGYGYTRRPLFANLQSNFTTVLSEIYKIKDIFVKGNNGYYR